MAKRRKRRSNGTRARVAGTLLFVLALLVLVSLVTHHPLDDARIRGEIDSDLNPITEIQYRNEAGFVGAILSGWLDFLFGWLAFFLPVGLLLASLRLFSSRFGTRLEFNVFLLFVISTIGTTIYNIHLVAKRTVGYETGAVGGYVTEKLTRLSVAVFGEIGSYLVLGGIILVLLLMYTSITPLLAMRLRIPGSQWLRRLYGVAAGAFRRLPSLRRILSAAGKEPRVDEAVSDIEPLESDLEPDEVDEGDEQVLVADDGERSPRRRSVLRRKAEPVQVRSFEYVYPSLDLLTEGSGRPAAVSADELTHTARMLKETLETFDVLIEGEIAKYPGPVITRYEFRPAAGIKLSRIVGLADDLALALKARRVRIIAPIPGKGAVGVEIPNRNPQTVYLRDILGSDEFSDPRLVLPLALGKTTAGRPFVTDLARMPHLLIAGATGSGKSVCMNALITSLIYRLHPLQVRFIFIDPKMLELSVYSGIPQLGRPVVTKPKRAESVLSDTVAEMENRYRKLAGAGVRSIEDYNARQHDEEARLPYILIFVDELADLMMASTSSRIELLITRLAQMARAVGIHLVLATQRPSVDVITGLIKANFPARIAFQVSSKVDSRTIIDANGAEKLLGSGDMLFLSTGQPEPTRIHGAYVSSAETESLVNFIKDQGLSMMALENISQATGEATEADIDFGDPLFREACEVVIRHKQGSVSLLQRRLGIGYQRAARLIDKLEKAGIVSVFDGSKARDVLVDQSYLETLFASRPGHPSHGAG
ncbi:MAG TPA: DNA translocase FtsK 4TM domain-containing protein [Acidobacteriota bacterium]|nr:DNA translocase FtsK 4TM domain-containing protein [Acidobacteriota bacterium]